MDNFQVAFVFDYCTITASCEADIESAPDLAWDWIEESTGLHPSVMNNAIDIIVESLELEEVDEEGVGV